MGFRHFTLLKLHRSVAQHKMGKVEVKFMWRHIGTLGQKTHVAQRAGIDDWFKIFTIHGVQFAGLRVINQIKQPGKRVAQVEASPTPVANIKNPSELGINGIGSVKFFLPGMMAVGASRLPSLITHSALF